MKFGKQLEASSLPQYKGHYLNYSTLKHLLKNNKEEFFQVLHVERERLNALVNGEIDAWLRRMDQLQSAFNALVLKDVVGAKEVGSNLNNGVNIDGHVNNSSGVNNPNSGNNGVGVNSKKNSFLELRLQLLELQKVVIQMEQFVSLNYTGFSKILKKHDKVTGKKTKDEYLQGLHENSFYSNFDSSKFIVAIEQLGDLISKQIASGPRETGTGTSSSSRSSSAAAAAASSGSGTPPLSSGSSSQSSSGETCNNSIRSFMFGTFLGQVANNIGQVVMPLVLFSYSTSPATVSLILTLTSVTNGIGSFLGGWIFGAMSQTRLLLLISNVARGIVLGLMALFYTSNSLNLITAAMFFCGDYAILGVIDTVRNAAPSSFVGQDRQALDAFNANYQIMFDLGTTVGPLLAGFAIQFWGFTVVLWMAPVAFILVGLNSTLIGGEVKEEGTSAEKNSPWASLKQLVSSPTLSSVFFLTLTLQLYRMKSLYSASFAEIFTSNPSTYTAWLMTVFGIGGLLGALLFRSSRGLSDKAFASWGYAGMLIFAVSWIPGDFWFATACIMFFSTTNVISRLCFQAKLQSIIKKGSSGGVMGLNRTGVKAITAIQQLAFGLSFTIATAVSAQLGGDISTIAFGLFAIFVLLLLLASFLLFRVQDKWSLLGDGKSEDGPSSGGQDEELATFRTLEGITQSSATPSTHLLSAARSTSPFQSQVGGNVKSTSLSSSNLRRRIQQQPSVSSPALLEDHLNSPLPSLDLSSIPESTSPPPNHGTSGLFIVFEGVDGSGKSTQLDWVAAKLSAEGYDVVVTRWNSSSLLSQIIKKAKRAHKMTPVTFSIMQAGDSAEQLKEVILPALNQGKIVLSDRYFYTALARDSVRGMKSPWLRSLFNFAVSPDLIMYFKVPVATAISRVLHRRAEIKKEKRRRARSRREKSVTPDTILLEYDSDGEGGNQSDEEETTGPADVEPDEGAVELNFYEAGLDCKLAEDPLENFHLFQSQVVKEYDSMVSEYCFKIIDATTTREKMFSAVQSHVLKVLASKQDGLLRCTYPDPLCLVQCGWFEDSVEVANRRERCSSAKNPMHLFFRMTMIPMRTRFSELMDLNDAPIVLLHGNPHVDNYAKTQRGTAMIDFDRSCYGPYPFDLARFMVSLSLFQSSSSSGLFLPAKVLESLKEGYLRGCTQPHLRFLEMRALRQKPSSQPLTMNEFVQSKKGWAKELNNNAIYAREDDVEGQGLPKDIEQLLLGYLESCNEQSLLDSYRVQRIATAAGSFGLDRYLVLLAPLEEASGLDHILIDLKSVIDCPKISVDGHYTNPFKHNGERMIEASKVHAPGFTQSEGYSTLNGKEYYGRRIPPWKDKVKGFMTEEELADLALAVGSQLGRGHKLSIMKTVNRIELITHFRLNFRAIVHAASMLKLELVTSYHRLQTSNN